MNVSNRYRPAVKYSSAKLSNLYVLRNVIIHIHIISKSRLLLHLFRSQEYFQTEISFLINSCQNDSTDENMS